MKPVEKKKKDMGCTWERCVCATASVRDGTYADISVTSGIKLIIYQMQFNSVIHITAQQPIKAANSLLINHQSWWHQPNAKQNQWDKLRHDVAFGCFTTTAVLHCGLDELAFAL